MVVVLLLLWLLLESFYHYDHQHHHHQTFSSSGVRKSIVKGPEMENASVSHGLCHPLCTEI